MGSNMHLRGFSGQVTNLRERMRFCHPILSTKNRGTDFLVVTDIQWSADGTGLEPVNEDEICSFGTMWTKSMRTIDPGVGVGLIGCDFMREVIDAVGVDVVESLPYKWDPELESWIAICQRTEFDECSKFLASSALKVFDRELRSCAINSNNLSKAGAAALFVLRRTPGRRETDVVIRELAATLIQREYDLYRRLLAVLSIKLLVDEDVLDKWAKRHLASIRTEVFMEELDFLNPWLIIEVKSTRIVSATETRPKVEWKLSDPLRIDTYVSKLNSEETSIKSSENKINHASIARYRRVKFHDHEARKFGIGSGIQGWTYG